MSTVRKTWMLQDETGKLVQWERMMLATTTHTRRHALPSATRNCSRYPWLPCAPQLHCYSATATPNPNTAYTAICHCLSLDHYRPPCGIGKTGLAIELRLPEHQGSIPSIPWKLKYHYQLLQTPSHFMDWSHLYTPITANMSLVSRNFREGKSTAFAWANRVM